MCCRVGGFGDMLVAQGIEGLGVPVPPEGPFSISLFVPDPGPLGLLYVLLGSCINHKYLYIPACIG